MPDYNTEHEKLDAIRDEVTLIRIKLFGNGHKTGSVDHRLEVVEKVVRVIESAIPNVMTKEECSAYHAAKRGSGRWVVEELNKAIPWLITLGALIFAATRGGAG